MKKFIYKMAPEEVAKMLQEGKVIKDITDDNVEYKLINGLLYNSETRCLGVALFLEDDGLYFKVEKTKSLEITETGLYKTRNGKQVYISKVDEAWTFGIIEGCDDTSNWNADGSFEDDSYPELDIVSKWED